MHGPSTTFGQTLGLDRTARRAHHNPFRGFNPREMGGAEYGALYGGLPQPISLMDMARRNRGIPTTTNTFGAGGMGRARTTTFRHGSATSTNPMEGLGSVKMRGPMGMRPAAVRPTSTSLKNLAPEVGDFVNQMFSHRTANFMGMGMMGVGALSAWGNARDGRYGRAAVFGGGLAYAGYQLYRHPARAASLANNLLGKIQASGPVTKISGMASSMMTALRASI